MLWEITRFFLLAIELSVVILGLAFGELILLDSLFIYHACETACWCRYMTHVLKGFISCLNFQSDHECDFIIVLLLFYLSSSLRSPGEQVQYQACAGDHCCAVSGLLHHTGNETGGDKKTLQVVGLYICGKLVFCMQWHWLCFTGNTGDPLPRQSPVCRRLQHLRTRRTTLLVGQLLFLLPGQ